MPHELHDHATSRGSCGASTRGPSPAGVCCEREQHRPQALLLEDSHAAGSAPAARHGARPLSRPLQARVTHLPTACSLTPAGSLSAKSPRGPAVEASPNNPAPMSQTAPEPRKELKKIRLQVKGRDTRPFRSVSTPQSTNGLRRKGAVLWRLRIRLPLGVLRERLRSPSLRSPLGLEGGFSPTNEGRILPWI